MKLRQKLMALLLTGSILFFGMCAVFFLSSTREFYLEHMAEGYETQLDSMDYVLSAIVSDKSFGQMGDLALEAYLKYQFRKCFGRGYAFLRDGQCLVNLTEFEILQPELLEEPYVVQHLGDRALLLMKKDMEEFPGYQVLMVQDITAFETALWQQLWEFFRICGGILLGMAVLVWLILRQVLKPLELLTRAAAELGEGNLKARAETARKDELGILARTFNQMAGQVERQVDDLRLLLGALTHEIKTPMTSIIGYGETLLQVKLPQEKQEQALRRIVHAGKRMERLSAKMLAMFGTYETDTIEKKPVSLAALLETVKEEEPILKEKGVRFETEFDQNDQWPQLPPLVGDQALLETLILNLVHNAVKASKTGGRVWLGADGDRLWVRDEGIGIFPEDLPHVTEAFYMADKSRSRSEGGSGLGLALCQRIAELHKMRLSIESEPGVGTTVSLYFPR